MSSQTLLVLERILGSALAMGATEVHFSAGARPDVLYDGKRELIMEEDILTPSFIEDAFAQFFPPEKVGEIKNAGDLEGMAEIAGVRCKVHAYYQRHALSLTVHPIKNIVPQELMHHVPAIVQSWLGKNHGIILVVGPAGSGKTTTAVALLQLVNQDKTARVLTLEKPVELILTNQKSIIEQREIGVDVKDWVSGFDSASQEQTDIVYVSEVSCVDQAQGVVKLATAGRLVIAVMTAMDTVDALALWPEWYPFDQQEGARERLAEHLIGAIALRRVVKTGGGAVEALEVLVNTQPVSAALRSAEWQQVRSVLGTSRGEGMISLDRALAELVKSGVVNQERAANACVDKNEFVRLIKR